MTELFAASCSAGLRQVGLDIVIHAEKVGGVIFPFDNGQARKIGTERCVDDLFNFDIERR